MKNHSKQPFTYNVVSPFSKWIFAVSFLFVSLLACERDQRAEKTDEPPDSRFGVDARGIQYIYLDHLGARQTATELAEIPAAYRHYVAVHTETLPPTDRMWLADLSNARSGEVLEAREGELADGHALSHAGAWGQTRAVFVVESAEYAIPLPEKAEKPQKVTKVRTPPPSKQGVVIEYASDAAPSTGVVKTTGSSGRHITMYRTKSCGWCRRAKRWLEKEGIPHTEKDVEESRANYDEWRGVCRRARERCSGVPTFVVDGEVVQGFDREELETLAKR